MVASRNTTLSGGVSKLSRSAVYRKRALYKRKKVAAAPAPKVEAETTKVKPIGGDKNGQERVVPVQKEPRFYPTEDVKKPLRHRKTSRPSRFRSHLGNRTIQSKRSPTATSPSVVCDCNSDEDRYLYCECRYRCWYVQATEESKSCKRDV